jgi:hypothetical protein
MSTKPAGVEEQALTFENSVKLGNQVTHFKTISFTGKLYQMSKSFLRCI